MNFITNLFEDKLNVDDRHPLTMVSLDTSRFLPSFLGIDAVESKTLSIGIVPPAGSFFVQLFILMIAQRVIAAFCAILTYKYIVVKTKSANSTKDIPNQTTMRFLVGFGVIIPIVAMSPFWFIRSLDIRSKVLRLLVCHLPITSVFRILEALFGFVPSAASASFESYVIYFTTLMEVVYDTRTQKSVKATAVEIVSLIKEMALAGVIIIVACSFFTRLSYTPFETGILAHSTDHTFLDLWNIGHILNNFLAATLLSLSLSWGSNGHCLLISAATGMKLERMVNNPMFASKSPSDFWGRRWNNVIHNALKRGVYKPMRKYCNKRSIAAAVTFFASGLIHEYTWAVLFFVHDNEKDDSGYCSACIYPHYGKNVIFFGWNGVLIVMEYMMSHFYLFEQIKKMTPAPVITMTVLITALPIGHLFTGDWIAGGYFEHLQLGFPILVVE